MSVQRKLKQQKARRSSRVHTKIRATSSSARLAVFKSLKHFYAQVIDDVQGVTLCACSTLSLKQTSGDKKTCARAVGSELAKVAQQKGIQRVVLDRGASLYHGRVKEFAEGAREAGLQF